MHPRSGIVHHRLIPMAHAFEVVVYGAGFDRHALVGADGPAALISWLGEA